MEWIPVSERLPELHIEYYEPLEHEQSSFTNTSYWISDPVLVTGTSRSTEDSPIFVAMYEDDGYGRTYWDDTFGGTLESVTAWMPLPKPYRKDKRKHPCDGCVHDRDEDVMTCVACVMDTDCGWR